MSGFTKGFLLLSVFFFVWYFGILQIPTFPQSPYVLTGVNGTLTILPRSSNATNVIPFLVQTSATMSQSSTTLQSTSLKEQSVGWAQKDTVFWVFGILGTVGILLSLGIVLIHIDYNWYWKKQKSSGFNSPLNRADIVSYSVYTTFFLALYTVFYGFDVLHGVMLFMWVWYVMLLFRVFLPSLAGFVVNHSDYEYGYYVPPLPVQQTLPVQKEEKRPEEPTEPIPTDKDMEQAYKEVIEHIKEPEDA